MKVRLCVGTLAIIFYSARGITTVDVRAGGNFVRTSHSGSIGLDVKDQVVRHDAAHSATLGVQVKSQSHAASRVNQSGQPIDQPIATISIGHRVGGLSLIFLSMSLSSIGFVLQRKSHLYHKQESQEKQESDESRWPRPLWLLGVVLYASAAAPDVLAYTLIPQVLCSSVGCVRIVMVSVLGHFFLGDRLKQREMVGSAVCTFGAILCVRFGPGIDLDKMPGDPGTFHHQLLIRYVASGILLLIFLMVVVHSKTSTMNIFVLPFTTSLVYGLEKVFNTEMSFISMPSNILHDAANITNVGYDGLWSRTLAAIACFGLLDFYLNLRAAKNMPVHVFVPLSFACGTVVQNFQGLVIFDEFRAMSVYQSALTCIGAFLALAGALVIQPVQLGGLLSEKQSDDEAVATCEKDSLPS